MASNTRSASVPVRPSAQAVADAATAMAVYINAVRRPVPALLAGPAIANRVGRANVAGTLNGRHVWTGNQIRDAIILKQYGGLPTSQIAVGLNRQYLTTKSQSTVLHILQIHSGTLPPSELRHRRGGLQPTPSPIWEWYANLRPTATVVRRVLTTYGLPTQALPTVQEEDEDENENEGEDEDDEEDVGMGDAGNDELAVEGQDEYEEGENE